jgi:ferredoxin
MSAEEDERCLLDRPSVVAALADYLLQVNYRGYVPDPSLVLAIRRSDRTAWLRRAELPVRWESYYFIEGELFPIPGATRLPQEKSPAEYAEELVARVWPQLWVWNGYDFTPSSSALNKNAYKKGERLPPLEWVSGRLNGEVFINVLRRAILWLVEKQGDRAVIPNLDLRYWAEDWLPIWSERHVGFIAGVGTFGLHAGLLTEKGAAGRMGSVVSNLPLPVRPRAYEGVYDYCLWKSEGRCRACIKRCPVGAINRERKDHILCTTNGANYIHPAYLAWGYHACGHCQNNLPCSNGIPGKRKRAAPPKPDFQTNDGASGRR